MTVALRVNCPECHAPLVRKPGGRCPSCNADVREHVQRAQERETRIEQIVAVVSTALVLGVSLFVGGCSLVEGIMTYSFAGVVMWLVARRTFY